MNLWWRQGLVHAEPPYGAREKTRTLQTCVLSSPPIMKNKLGIKTEKGQLSEAQGREAIKAFSDAHPSLDYVFTNPKELAVVDGFIVNKHQNTLYGVVEAKARNMTLEKLRGDYGNRWMVSVDKLDRGRLISEMLAIPFIGICRLNPDNKFLVVQLTDKNGKFVVDYEEREVTTQAIVGDIGRKREGNAFINMNDAKEYNL